MRERCRSRRLRRLLLVAATIVFVLTGVARASGPTFSDDFNRPDGTVGNGWHTWWGFYNVDGPGVSITGGKVRTLGYGGAAGGIFRSLPVTYPVQFSFDFSTDQTAPVCSSGVGNGAGWLLGFNAGPSSDGVAYHAPTQLFMLQYAGGTSVQRYWAGGADYTTAAGQRDYTQLPAHITGEIDADWSGTMTVDYGDGGDPASVMFTFPPASGPIPSPEGDIFFLGNSSCENGPFYFDNFSISSSGGGGGGDTTPPTLTVSDIAVNATSPSGATVSAYPASATDDVDPSPSVSCSPAAPHLFAIGDSTVACTASDASGNTSAQKTFTVHVRDAEEQADALFVAVDTLAVDKGFKNELERKLLDADKQFQAGKLHATCKKLGDFQKRINDELKKKPKDQKITTSQAQPLLDAAQRIENVIGC